MTHANHPSLPGFDPRQLLVDGCPECEERGSDYVTAICHLDGVRFRAAWERAAAWQSTDSSEALAIAVAEVPMLRALWAVQVMFERLYRVPLGELPPGLLLYR